MKQNVIAIRVKEGLTAMQHEFGAAIVAMAYSLNNLWNDAENRGLINRPIFVEVECESVGTKMLHEIAEFLNCDYNRISSTVEMVFLPEAE